MKNQIIEILIKIMQIIPIISFIIGIIMVIFKKENAFIIIIISAFLSYFMYNDIVLFVMNSMR